MSRPVLPTRSRARGRAIAFTPALLVALPAILGAPMVPPSTAQPADPGAGPGRASFDSVRVVFPEVAVTALRDREDVRRIPAAAFVMPRAQLQRTAAPRVSTLLASLPGLFAYQEGATGDPLVVDPRGFTANGLSSYLKVLLDGQDTREVENGNVDWDWLVPEDAERVEVVQGPGAWAYGDGAEGGILNIVRPTPLEGWNARAALRGGSFGQAGGNAALGWARGRWSTALEGGGRVADGWRERSREEIVSLAARASRRGADLRWSGSASWLDTDREDPGYLTPDQLAADREQAENPADYARARRLLVRASLATGGDGEGDDEWRLSPYARIEDGEQVKTLFFETRHHPTDAHVAGAEFSWRRETTWDGHPLALNAGASGEYSDLTSEYRDGATGDGPLITATEARRRAASAFAGARLDVSDVLTARAGLRGDWIQVASNDAMLGPLDEADWDWRTIYAVSPYLAVSRALGTRASVYASASEAFHAPTLDQLYGARPISNPVPPFDPPFFTISNDDLDPQRATSVEVGGRWDGTGGASAMLTAYGMWVRDEIDFDLVTFRYQNLARSLHQGVIATGAFRCCRGCPCSRAARGSRPRSAAATSTATRSTRCPRRSRLDG